MAQIGFTGALDESIYPHTGWGIYERAGFGGMRDYVSPMEQRYAQSVPSSVMAGGFYEPGPRYPAMGGYQAVPPGGGMLGEIGGTLQQLLAMGSLLGGAKNFIPPYGSFGGNADLPAQVIGGSLSSAYRGATKTNISTDPDKLSILAEKIGNGLVNMQRWSDPNMTAEKEAQLRADANRHARSIAGAIESDSGNAVMRGLVLPMLEKISPGLVDEIDPTLGLGAGVFRAAMMDPANMLPGAVRPESLTAVTNALAEKYARGDMDEQLKARRGLSMTALGDIFEMGAKRGGPMAGMMEQALAADGKEIPATLTEAADKFMKTTMSTVDALGRIFVDDRGDVKKLMRRMREMSGAAQDQMRPEDFNKFVRNLDATAKLLGMSGEEVAYQVQAMVRGGRAKGLRVDAATSQTALRDIMAARTMSTMPSSGELQYSEDQYLNMVSEQSQRTAGSQTASVAGAFVTSIEAMEASAGIKPEDIKGKTYQDRLAAAAAAQGVDVPREMQLMSRFLGKDPTLTAAEKDEVQGMFNAPQTLANETDRLAPGSAWGFFNGVYSAKGELVAAEHGALAQEDIKSQLRSLAGDLKLPDVAPEQRDEVRAAAVDEYMKRMAATGNEMDAQAGMQAWFQEKYNMDEAAARRTAGELRGIVGEATTGGGLAPFLTDKTPVGVAKYLAGTELAAKREGLVTTMSGIAEAIAENAPARSRQDFVQRLVSSVTSGKESGTFDTLMSLAGGVTVDEENAKKLQAAQEATREYAEKQKKFEKGDSDVTQAELDVLGAKAVDLYKDVRFKEGAVEEMNAKAARDRETAKKISDDTTAEKAQKAQAEAVAARDAAHKGGTLETKARADVSGAYVDMGAGKKKDGDLASFTFGTLGAADFAAESKLAPTLAEVETDVGPRRGKSVADGAETGSQAVVINSPVTITITGGTNAETRLTGTITANQPAGNPK